jgi:hypothetical protein
VLTGSKNALKGAGF